MHNLVVHTGNPELLTLKPSKICIHRSKRQVSLELVVWCCSPRVYIYMCVCVCVCHQMAIKNPLPTSSMCTDAFDTALCSPSEIFYPGISSSNTILLH